MGIEEFLDASASYPPPDSNSGGAAALPSYGTAGFRAKAHLLPSTVFRCGGLIALRSMKLDGAVTGLMITASHNPEEDNGVKLVEPMGEMLVPAWELHATTVAHATDSTPGGLKAALESIVAAEEIAVSSDSAKVILAYDTRPSSVALAEAAKRGAEAMGAQVVDLGLRTTPQLHWAIRATNLGREDANEEKAYFRELTAAYGVLVKDCPALPEPTKVLVDCANGVGGRKVLSISHGLKDFGLHLEPRNMGYGTLNYGCGSDHVHTKKQPPSEIEAPKDAGVRCVSVDGDADRLVYFQLLPTEGNAVQLFDGDKIACLAAVFLKDTLAALPGGEGFSLGVVQTAYANGAATRFLRESLGVQTAMAKTGVKHLHAEAVKFDVGIYFESNGHGTVIFSSALLDHAKRCAAEHQEQQQQEGPGTPSNGGADIMALSLVINQAVGDALSGILLVECILRRKGWSLEDWAAIYTDLPSRQLKVRVADRTIVTTTADESTCTAPEGLQAAIESEVAQVPSGRSFVRPSGTEDVVRVYAEATTQEATDSLAAKVARLTFDFAGGVGDPPPLA